MHAQTKELQIQDPRLGPLPDGWRIKDHKEARLWNWYVNDDKEIETTTELKWRSDPRLTATALRDRGVVIEAFRLV